MNDADDEEREGWLSLLETYVAGLEQLAQLEDGTHPGSAARLKSEGCGEAIAQRLQRELRERYEGSNARVRGAIAQQWGLSERQVQEIATGLRALNVGTLVRALNEKAGRAVLGPARLLPLPRARR